jgi:hypothetical protein
MAQDLRNMIKEHAQKAPHLPFGHEERFEARLDKAFAQRQATSTGPVFMWMKIAAIGIVFMAVGAFGYYSLFSPGAPEQQTVVSATGTDSGEQSTKGATMTLADVSPDLKKLETYYTTGINVQLASLQVTEENKELIDGYMERLAELATEYTTLTSEMGEVGPTEATITAMIDNLKLRLELLFKLKNKLKELKNKDYENVTTA